jgi:UPF0755 protein
MQQISQKKILFIIISILIILGVIFSYFFYFKNKFANTETMPTTQQIILDSTEKNTIPEIVENVDLPKKVTPIPMPIGTDRFIVSLKDTNENITTNLFNQGYVKDQNSFLSLLATNTINPGGYKISKEMNEGQIIQTLKGKPYMKWVVIPEGLRKEEIAKILALNLGWSAKQKDTWLKTDTMTKSEYQEGVYFPDTYLIPLDESTSAVASRLISKFNENFSPLLPKFTAKNIKWTTALTLASIVQREASNNADTPLIAGILWNRLNQKMQLGVDATLQYARGDDGNGWWAPISIALKKIDSPYNTYIHTGLPPHPISNPGITAIGAVLNPTTTDCLYYLHDKNHITHCAITYEEHQANIEKYLKNNL